MSVKSNQFTFLSIFLKGEADKNLTLMKEAHRAEVDALQSKVSSLAKDLNDSQNKQKILTQEHQTELALAETAKNDEINKLRDRMHSNEVDAVNSKWLLASMRCCQFSL